MGNGIASISGSASAASRALAATLERAWLRVRAWIARVRQRRELTELSDRLLRDIGVIRERDIGVSRAAEERDALKLFWSP